MIGGIIRPMKNLESMERGTPEFNALTKEQQELRREALCSGLNALLNHKLMGINEKEAVYHASELLEYHLTGRVERLPVEKREKLKKRRT